MLRGMTWESICDDPALAELPYKIETDEWGNLVMSPHRFQHSKFQGKIAALLLQLLPDGEIFPECPLKTSKGTKVIDMAWMTPACQAQTPPQAAACRVAPELCIEVLSPKNQRAEIEQKKALYFEKGAVECWVCDRQGHLTFFNVAGPLNRSELCPDFPEQLTPP